MFRKIVRTVLIFALLLSAVCIGLHVTNREAHAEEVYLVRMLDWVGQDQFEIIEGDDIDVEMNFFIGEVWGGWIEATYTGNGWFKVVKSGLSEWVPWQVRYSNNELPPCNPDENPCDGPELLFSFEWILGGNWR